MANDEDGLTFEDLAIDDTLDDLGRVCQYCFSPIALQRLEVSQEKLFPLLDPLSKDHEYVVRQNLAQQVWGLAQVCVEGNTVAGYAAIVECILPVLARLVADAQPEVRLAAGESLVEVAKHVKKKDLGARVLTFVLELAHDDEEEELRMTAAVLLNELAPTLGKELCQQFIVPEVVSLSEDPTYRVRKATALNMNNICATAGPELTSKRLLPAFVRLSKDDIWGVRKAVAESLVAMARSVNDDVRASMLIPICERYVGEPSRWVRTATLHHIGPFLSTLPSPKITPSLLSHYTNMGSTLKSQAVRLHAAELRIFCAFSFPAVAQTLGPERWGELRSLFRSLTRDVTRKVRRTLAYSLHEIAKILGPEMAEAELESTFQFYLKDLEEVRAGVITHVAAFLGALSPACRESYLPILGEIITGNARIHWRFRHLLAKQVGTLSHLFSSAATYSVVVPLAIDLLKDDVAMVRTETTKHIGALVRRLGEADPSWRITVVEKLLELGKSKNYQHRLTLVKFCSCLCKDMEPSIFSSLFLPSLVVASKDYCRNVRLAVVRLFSSDPRFQGPDWLLQNPQVTTTLQKMSDDKDAEVARVAKLALATSSADAAAGDSTPEDAAAGAGGGAGAGASAGEHEREGEGRAPAKPLTPAQLDAVRQIANTAAQLALADALRKMGSQVSASVTAARAASAGEGAGAGEGTATSGRGTAPASPAAAESAATASGDAEAESAADEAAAIDPGMVALSVDA